MRMCDDACLGTIDAWQRSSDYPFTGSDLVQDRRGDYRDAL